jgi:dihydrofolate reductase
VSPLVTLVLAVADNGVIGRDNALPWHLPADLAHFKQVTLGKPIVMGRRTFASIGRPLAGRQNVVVTRDSTFAVDGVTVAHSFDEALTACGAVPEVMVIGGAAIFAAALPRAGRIHLTRVHATVAGDVHFPPLDPQVWQEVASQARQADARNAYAMSFVTLERR